MRTLITAQTNVLGGIERRLIPEIAVLRDLGSEVFVAVPRFNGYSEWAQQVLAQGAHMLDWNPYKVVERSHHWPPFRWLAMTKVPLLMRTRIDLAHVPLSWTTQGLSRALILREAGIPYVLSLHCTYPKTTPAEPTRHLIARALEGMVGAYGVSQTALDSFLANFGELLPNGCHLEVVPNGIDTERFAPNAVSRKVIRQELGIPENALLILFCGRLAPMKRPELALEILAALLDQGQDVHLVMIGEGLGRNNLEKRARALGVTQRLSMPGFKDQVAPYMAASDLYLSTSTSNEGFPLSTSEALSSGLPAFVPDHPVFRSCYSTCASVRFIDSDNPTEWAKEIIAFMSGESQRVMSARRAREYALDHLSDVGMKNQLCAFYRDIFNKFSLLTSGA